MARKFVAMSIGEHKFQVPEMTVSQLEDFLDTQKQIANSPDFKSQLNIYAEMILIALRKVEHSFSVESLKDELTLKEMMDAVMKVGDTSGLVRSTPGELTLTPENSTSENFTDTLQQEHPTPSQQ